MGRQNKQDIAFSHYLQVTNIWHEHLRTLVDQRITEPPPLTGIGPAQISIANREYDFLDEAQAAEAVQVLGSILEMREQQTAKNPSVMATVYFTLAMLYLVLQETNKATSFAEKAVSSASQSSQVDSEKTSVLWRSIPLVKWLLLESSAPPLLEVDVARFSVF